MKTSWEEKWDGRYMTLAMSVSTWSKDPSTQIGAVAVGKHGQILSTGYNGFPRGIADTRARLYDRPTKYQYTIHAEMNAIFNAALSNVSLESSTLYVYGLPICSECAKGVIQAGINRVVVAKKHIDECQDRWKESWELSKSMFLEAGVIVDLI